jgi:hypothetical protein
MLVQSFLLGQKEFRTIMRSPSFEQLRQRVIAAYHLQPLDASETKGYVEHRLGLVGWQQDPRIHEDAYEAIYQFSEGVPRRVNTLCDRLFLHACLEELHEISRATVDAVTQDIVEEQGLGPGAEVSEGPSAHDPWANRWGSGGPGAASPASGRAADASAGSPHPDRVARVEESVEALTEAFRNELAELRRAILAASSAGKPDKS